MGPISGNIGALWPNIFTFVLHTYCRQQKQTRTIVRRAMKHLCIVHLSAKLAQDFIFYKLSNYIVTHLIGLSIL